MAGQTIFTLTFAALLLIGGESATFTITNNCPNTIWPAAITADGSPSQPSKKGFELSSQASDTIDIPSPGPTSGRIWARTFCTATCLTGDCGNGGGPCNGAGVPPATLVEFTLNDNGGKDTYDVSNVDGFNLRVSVAPENSACPPTNCLADINAECPADRSRKGGNGETVGCISDCEALHRAEDCCTYPFNTTSTCTPSPSARYFKEKCPLAYGFAFHDQSSTFTCPTGTNYKITFCP